MASTKSDRLRSLAYTRVSFAALCIWTAATWAQPDPGSCQNALVVDGFVCLTDDETYECVTVESGGVLCTNGATLTVTAAGGLTIEDGGKLTIDAGSVSPRGRVVLSGGGTHAIGGVIEIPLESLALAGCLSIVDEDAVLDGGGKISGGDNGAKIVIDAGVKLRIAPGFTVEGALEIEGLFDGSQRGAFENDGLVRANAQAGTIHLMSNTVLDGSDGDWKADTFDTAVLWFSRAQTACGVSGALTGDFSVADCACLDFDAEIRTSGGFMCDGMLGGCVDGTLIYECDTTAEGCGTCD